MSIVVGEPIVDYAFTEHAISPLGQLKQCIDVRAKYPERKLATDRLRQEYKSIIRALTALEIEYTVAVSHQEDFDRELWQFLLSIEGLRATRLPERVRHEATAFPRDFCTALPGITLLHPFNHNLESDEIITSPYGEGGKVLYCGNKVLIGEDVYGDDFHCIDHIELLASSGIEVGALPLSLSGGSDRVCALGGHLDRVACLIEGTDGRTHLVVDPEVESLYPKGKVRFGRQRAGLVSNAETLAFIQDVCDKMEIKLHTPDRIIIPGSLCLIQFDNGKVLMTSGDDFVAETICDIAGRDNVYFTDTAIEAYPAFVFAGIRCLIGEIP